MDYSYWATGQCLETDPRLMVTMVRSRLSVISSPADLALQPFVIPLPGRDTTGLDELFSEVFPGTGHCKNRLG